MTRFKLFTGLTCLLFTATSNAQSHSKLEAQRLLASRPVKFLENNGQMTDMEHNPVSFVLFKAAAPGLDLYLTEKGLSYIFNEEISTSVKAPLRDLENPQQSMAHTAYKWERVDMSLKGASILKENIVKEEPEQGLEQYYLAHCPNGIKNVKHYGKLTVKNVYPGIDWVLYNTDKNGFKYDFVLHPGADASHIQMLYSSLQPLILGTQGELVLNKEKNALTEKAPFTYVMGTNNKISSQYHLLSSEKKDGHFENLVGFKFNDAGLFRSQTVIIDPQLIWATAIGGSGQDMISAVAHDPSGNIFITGRTQSTNYPVMNSGTYFQGTVTVNPPNSKIFITKFNSAGVLLWSTFYGGSGSESAYSITVDSLSNIFVTGITSSNDFPTHNASTFFQGSSAGQADVFILKFDNAGNRLWATYYGGSDLDMGYTVKTDKQGNLFMVGLSYSSDFPLQNAGTYYDSISPGQGHLNGFILKFDNTGARLWATFFDCDRLNNIAVDGNGDIYVTGFTYASVPIPTLNPGNGAYFQAPGGSSETFIAKFNNMGTLLWSTYYGGNKEDYGRSVIADKTGNVYLSGVTRSTNLPVMGSETSYSANISSASLAEVDAFIAKFNQNGALVWATYCGGSGHEEMIFGEHLAVDACNSVYLAFESVNGAPTFTACEGGYEDSTSAGSFDQYLMRFSNLGVLQWATYFGGVGPETGSFLDITNNGDLYMVGRWDIGNTPATYTFVNPGGGAYFNSSGNGLDDGGIARFASRLQSQDPDFYYSTVCVGDSQSVAPIYFAGFVNGGEFSASQGINVNQQTGLINLAGVSVGNYTISYQWEACKCFYSKSILSVVQCVGEEEYLSNDVWFKIHGNPNSGEFKVSSNKQSTLTLFDELGQEMGRFSLSEADNYQIFIKDLNPGVYFLRSDHSTATHKIVVIRQ